MKFRYVGDDNDPPTITRPFGYEFKLNGAPVDVREPVAIKKLKGSRCFKEVRTRGDSSGTKKAGIKKAGHSDNTPSPDK